MLGTSFVQLVGLLERRFVVGWLLPAAAFTTAVLAVVLAGGGGLDGAAATWEAQEVVVRAGLVVLALTWVFGLAVFLSSQAFAVVRGFEGYWLVPASGASRSLSWHRRRRARLLHPDAYAEGWTEYPLPSSDVLPTRFGNILRSGEAYSYERYGADSVLVWPRLYQLLDPPSLEPLAQARSSMEQMLVLSVLSGAVGAAGSTYLAVVALDLGWALGVLVTGAVLAWAFHRAALAHAVVYSGQLRAVFDLHRRALLKALGFPVPRTVTDERQSWRKAQLLVYRSISPDTITEDEAPEPLASPEPAEPAGPGINERLSPLAASMIAGLFGFAGLLAVTHGLSGQRDVTVVSAAGALDAGHVLTADDLRQSTIDRGDSDGTFRRGSELVGRAVVDDLAAGTPIRDDDVGSDPLVDGERVVGLAVTGDVVLSEPFVKGDQVDLLLGPARSRGSLTLSDVLVADVTDDDPQVLALVLDHHEAMLLVEVIDRAPVVVSRSCC